MSYIWCRALYALTLLALAANPAFAQSAFLTSDIAAVSRDTPLKVCTHNLAPLSICNATESPNTYTGFDVEMFRDAALLLGLREGVNYEFFCSDFNTVLNATSKNVTTDPELAALGCSVGVGGFTITLEREKQQGIRFSRPYYHSNLAIVVPAYVASSSGWAWLEPFSSSMWIAVFVTMVVFPVLVFLLEFLALKKKVYLSDFPSGVQEATVRSLWTLFGQETMEVSTFGARIAVMCFAFMALIISSTYTANLAAVLTVQRARTDINSISDLRGQVVVTSPIYVNILRKTYAIQAISNYTLDEETGLLQAFSDLNAGYLDAIIGKETSMRQVDELYPSCSIKMLPMKYHRFSYGLTFPPSPIMENGTINAFSDAILALEESGRLEELENNLIDEEGTSGCDATLGQGKTYFMDVWGLWAIMLAGLVLGFMIMLYTRHQMVKNGHWPSAKTLKKSAKYLDNDTSPTITGPYKPAVLKESKSKLPALFRLRKKSLRKTATTSTGSRYHGNVGDVETGDGAAGVSAFAPYATTNSSNSSPSVSASGLSKGPGVSKQPTQRRSALQQKTSLIGDTVIWHTNDDKLSRSLSEVVEDDDEDDAC